MIKLTAANLAKRDFDPIVTLQDQGINDYPWLQAETIILTEAEHQRLHYLQRDLLNCQVQLLNEATGRSSMPESMWKNWKRRKFCKSSER